MTIKVGERLPDATFKTKSDDGVSEVSSDSLFKGKKVVLFAVPGAFTPTCSMNHQPGYLANRDAILAKGVDTIAVVAVNDPHVMGAWAKATNGAGKIQYLSDGNATFTKAVGLDIDLAAGTMGVRSKRYSMLVEDGVVKELNIEDSPGQAVTSSAAPLLGPLYTATERTHARGRSDRPFCLLRICF